MSVPSAAARPVTSMTARLLVLGALLLGFVVQSATPSFACSCMFTEPEEALAQVEEDPSAVILIGTITRVIDDRAGYEVEVEGSYGGTVAPTVQVRDEMAGTSCQSFYDAGVRIAAGVYDQGGVWVLGACNTHDPDTLLKIAAPNAPDGEAVTPTDDEPAVEEASSNTGLFVIGGTGLAAAAIFGAVLVFGRRPDGDQAA